MSSRRSRSEWITALEPTVAALWSSGAAEPRSVFDLFCTPKAVAKWRATVGPHVRYSTVFTHQRPYVRASSNGTPIHCELSDLLLVFSWPERRRRVAYLLQAKRCNPNLRWPARDDQWALYTGWPKFRYRAGPHVRVDVELPAHRPLSRALYLLLPPEPRPIVSMARPLPPMPKLELFTNTSFWPSELYSKVFWTSWLLGLMSGPYARYAPPPWCSPFTSWLADRMVSRSVPAFSFQEAKDMSHWSRLVWDLLRHTANQKAPRRQVAATPGTLRGNVMMFANGAVVGGGGEPEEGVEECTPDGFGVVHFEFHSGRPTEGVPLILGDERWSAD